jgi:hypothetical protein
MTDGVTAAEQAEMRRTMAAFDEMPRTMAAFDEMPRELRDFFNEHNGDVDDMAWALLGVGRVGLPAVQAALDRAVRGEPVGYDSCWFKVGRDGWTEIDL